MNFLSEALKDGEPGPSCHVCGAIMSREPLPHGKDLACWCRLDQPCRADVLLKIANQNRPWNCLSCGASTGVR